MNRHIPTLILDLHRLLIPDDKYLETLSLEDRVNALRDNNSVLFNLLCGVIIGTDLTAAKINEFKELLSTPPKKT